METVCKGVGRHGTSLRALPWCPQADMSATRFAKVSASLLRVESRNIHRWQWRTRLQSRDRAMAVRASAHSTVAGADKKLPDKKKALYSHSLPSIEQWLTSLGFYQSKVDRAIWLVERQDWHAQLSLDITELHIKYLKSGPGNLEKDVERKFSYALSREDLDNAILGGP